MSEHQAEGQLDAARELRGAVLAEGEIGLSTGGVELGCGIDAVEVGVVEDVVELGAELAAEAFGEREVFEERGIPTVDAGSAE